MIPTHERLFADAAQAVLVFDPADGRIRYANGGAGRLLGYEPAELLDESISSIYKEQASELETFLARVLEYGHGWTKDLVLRTNSGASVPAEIFALLIESGAQGMVLVLTGDRSQNRQPGREPPPALA
jgi:PAS domain S-box-containing protein